MADEPLLLGLPDGNLEENDDKICGWSTNKIGGTPLNTFLRQGLSSRIFVEQFSSRFIRHLLGKEKKFEATKREQSDFLQKEASNAEKLLRNQLLILTQNWLFGQPSQYPTCALCNSLLYLVCQIYCPLSNSVFHRVLYIFGCVNASCWNKNKSWKVLRAQAKDSNFVCKETAGNQSSSRFEVDDWCDDAEDWGEPDDMSSRLDELTGKLKLAEDKPDKVDCNKVLPLSMSGQHEEVSPSCVPHFAPLYISVIEAPDTRGISKQMTHHEKILLVEYERREGLSFVGSMDSGDDVKGWKGEKYESEAVKHGDKAFHKFHKQLQSCPQQCLRYQWNGMPVSMVTTQPSELCSKVPPCQHCGASRVFEVQFMPALVAHLKVPQQQDVSPKHVEPENETVVEQFTQRNIKCDLQSLNNSFHAGIGEILTQDTNAQQKQRKTCMAAVNQKCDVTIEFGTVMVFTCSKSCWTEMESVAGEFIYLEEFCLVEADPDAMLFE